MGLTSRSRAELYLFLITFVWGSTFVITKDILQYFTPFLTIALRFSVASVVFVVLARSSVHGWTARTAVQGTVLGLLLFAGFALQTVGLQYTTASKSAFITGMLVIFTPLWQVVIERRPPRTGSVIGIVCVLAGLYLLTSPGGSGFTTGDGMTLVAAVVFGLYIVLLDVYGSAAAATKLSLAQFVVTGGAAWVMVLVAEDPSWEWTTVSSGELIYLAIFATVIALYVQTRYQKDSTPTRAAVIFSLEPVIAAGFAYLLAGEVLGVVGSIGGGLIVAGVLVSELSDSIFKPRHEGPEAVEG